MQNSFLHSAKPRLSIPQQSVMTMHVHSAGPLSSMRVVRNSVHSLGGQNVLLPISDGVF